MVKPHEYEYLGDGVYVYYDGSGGIELRANDHLNPTDKIYLEQYVLDKLVRFIKEMENAK